MSGRPTVPPIRTSTLLAYLLSLYAMMAEGLLLLSHLNPNKQFAMAKTVLAGILLLFFIITWRRRDELRALRCTGGRIELTPIQIVLVTLVVGAIGCLPEILEALK
jgi:hypothetical protein